MLYAWKELLWLRVSSFSVRLDRAELYWQPASSKRWRRVVGTCGVPLHKMNRDVFWRNRYCTNKRFHSWHPITLSNQHLACGGMKVLSCVVVRPISDPSFLVPVDTNSGRWKIRHRLRFRSKSKSRRTVFSVMP